MHLQDAASSSEEQLVLERNSDSTPQPDEPLKTTTSPAPDPTKTEPSDVNGDTETSSKSESSSMSQQDIINVILHFLSTADTATIGAVAVGLSAVTYIVLGRLGLVLIGAFGGVALFVSWERSNPEASRALQREKGVDVIERLLGVRKDATPSSSILDLSKPLEDATLLTLDGFKPETRAALDELLDAVIRDYVKWWYSPLVPAEDSFPLACRRTLASFIASISHHLGRKRPADGFIDLLTNCSSMVIVFFAELSSAFADIPADADVTAAEAVYTYITSNPECSLANLLSQKQQASKFRMISEDLLGFLNRSAYQCDPAHSFLREILGGVVLEKTLQTCSKPEWINGWIVYLLEGGEPDFNQAIDEGMQTSPDFAGFDASAGNAETSKVSQKSDDAEKASFAPSHSLKLSKTVEEDALLEMKRLNEMIAEDEAKRKRLSQGPVDAPARLGSPLHVVVRESRISPEPLEPSEGVAVESHGYEQLTAQSPKHLSPQTPRTPRTPIQSTTPTNPPPSGPFTSFDQFLPPNRLRVPDEEDEPPKPPPLTLHNASITIYDDAPPDKNKMRNKPTWDYLVQIEPASIQHPGWMIVRKYADFEALHEVLRRIANISGATDFTHQHGTLPHWKAHTRESLRVGLERYMRDACFYEPLAESSGLKRFFEKTDQGPAKNESKSAIEAFGKNMLGAITSAPKGALEGSKAVVGGMTGVLGNIGLGQKRGSMSARPRGDSMPIRPGSFSLKQSNDSMDSKRSSVVSLHPVNPPAIERQPSNGSFLAEQPTSSDSLKPVGDPSWDRPTLSNRSSRASSVGPTVSPSAASLENLEMKLPPRPDEIPDSYSPTNSEAPSRMDSIMTKQDSMLSSTSIAPSSPTSTPISSGSSTSSKTIPPPHNSESDTHPPTQQQPPPSQQQQQAQCQEPLTESETRVAIELVFAMINEMYTLSSAWNFRRTLLAAAKSFLLRPGNPSLSSIRQMIQLSLLDPLSSDARMAAKIQNITRSALPTEEERAAWPAEMTAEEKERLRGKARRLLVESGVPTALMGVMGQGATGTAVGRVFDALQVEDVSRGIVFGVLLQGVRGVTH